MTTVNNKMLIVENNFNISFLRLDNTDRNYVHDSSIEFVQNSLLNHSYNRYTEAGIPPTVNAWPGPQPEHEKTIQNNNF